MDSLNKNQFYWFLYAGTTDEKVVCVVMKYFHNFKAVFEKIIRQLKVWKLRNRWRNQNL